MLPTRLLWIELHKCKLLDLTDIQTIRIDFRERFHWILGSNGSGKSSIVKECTPLAFEAENFEDGGYKKTYWQVGDRILELSSHKNPKRNTHHFFEIVDGIPIELNPGHTSTVYKNLVQEHFGITRETHQVATGKLRLTKMDAGSRKSLFTSLSAIDYTYALAYYKRLYTSYRDLLGSVKTDQGRLVEIKASTFNAEEEKQCLDEIRDLKLQVERLLELRPNVSSHAHEVRQRIRAVNDQIERAHRQAVNYSQANKHLYPLAPIEQLRGLYANLQAQYQLNEQSMDELYRKFEKLSQKANELATKSGASREELEEAREKVLASLEGISYKILSAETNLSPTSPVLEEAYGDYIATREHMFAMDPEETSDFDRYRTTYHELFVVRNKTVDNISRLRADIAEIKSHEHEANVECPQCSHKFNPAFSKLKLDILERDLAREGKSLETYQEKLDEAESNVKRMDKYLRGQEHWGRLIRKYPILNDVWGAATREKLNHLDAFAIDQIFTDFRLELVKRAGELTRLQELKTLNERIEWARKVSEDSFLTVQAEVKEARSRLDYLQEQRNVLLDAMNDAKGRIELSERLRKAGEEAKEMKQNLIKLVEQDYDHLERETINDLIRGIDKEITTREERLRTIHSKNSEILRLEKMIADTEGRVRALKDALQVLSPSEGLIARGLTGFINHFTGLMNAIIERIMTYEMRMPPLMPSNEDFELDFSLPIMVKSSLVSDIGECSLGQSEIIDLAFRILYLKFKGLDGGLLSLDEFGANLDHVHQQRAYDAVRKLLTTTNFSQVLMVSHMSSTYGLMDGASVTVICPANVNIPGGVTFNDTTTITRR